MKPNFGFSYTFYKIYISLKSCAKTLKIKRSTYIFFTAHHQRNMTNFFREILNGPLHHRYRPDMFFSITFCESSINLSILYFVDRREELYLIYPRQKKIIHYIPSTQLVVRKMYYCNIGCIHSCIRFLAKVYFSIWCSTLKSVKKWHTFRNCTVLLIIHTIRKNSKNSEANFFMKL